MFSSVFGTELPLAARFFIAFLVVLALIGLTAWLMRRFGASRLGGGSARGRQPRLAVIDAATVDGRRRLVLIRRDNVEHLLMIGPSDLVIESNIVRAASARDVPRDAMRAVNEPPRVAPPAETPWPLQPVASEPAARATRPSVTDEPWLAAEPGARARPVTDGTGAPNVEPVAKSPTPEPPAGRPEPVRVTPPAPAAPPQTDHNLAEMALQLEAALRRPPENRPPVTDPLAVASPAPPVKPAEPAVRAPNRDFKPRVEPKLETKTEPKMEPKAEPKPEPSSAKSSFDNLEQEMASLLGRPLGKS
ncbi:MAG TPA: flagellar biosynthetic protein FliO [Pseudolabrys sp.]|nr:flagellar biosynthetic protein FliO [Pseudolabrys sp.]